MFHKQLILTVLLIGLVSIAGRTQEKEIVQSKDHQENAFNRKGKILLEMDYSDFIFTGGSGFAYTNTENIDYTEVALDGGYFVGQNTALTFGFYSSSREFSLSSFGLGLKHYFSGKVPFDLSLGRFSQFGDGRFFSTAHLGYSILFADNISFEPALGLYYYDKSANFNARLSFALFL